MEAWGCGRQAVHLDAALDPQVTLVTQSCTCGWQWCHDSQCHDTHCQLGTHRGVARHWHDPSKTQHSGWAMVERRCRGVLSCSGVPPEDSKRQPGALPPDGQYNHVQQNSLGWCHGNFRSWHSQVYCSVQGMVEGQKCGLLSGEGLPPGAQWPKQHPVQHLPLDEVTVVSFRPPKLQGLVVCRQVME